MGLVDLGSDGIVSLVGLDGVIRTDVTSGDVGWSNIGKTLLPQAELLVAARRAPVGRYWSTPDTTDNVKRLISYRRLESHPLIAVVGVTEAEAYRLWQARSGIYWGIALLVTPAILLVILLGAMREHKLNETTSEMERARALIEESHGNLVRAELMALLGHYKSEEGSGAFIWSEGAYRIMGKSPESYAPTLSATLELYHPDDRPILQQYRRDVANGIEPPRVTLRVLKPGGRIAYVEIWMKPVLDRNGKVTGRFGTMQDITERKRVEETLAKANEQLELRVAERTFDLMQTIRERERTAEALRRERGALRIGRGRRQRWNMGQEPSDRRTLPFASLEEHFGLCGR